MIFDSPPRSKYWPEKKDRHLKANPFCVFCERKADTAHHVYPVSKFPDLELEEIHYRSVCEFPGDNCHLYKAHCGNWSDYLDPNVFDSIAKTYRLLYRRVKNRRMNPPTVRGVVNPEFLLSTLGQVVEGQIRYEGEKPYLYLESQGSPDSCVRVSLPVSPEELYLRREELAHRLASFDVQSLLRLLMIERVLFSNNLSQVTSEEGSETFSISYVPMSNLPISFNSNS